MSVQNDVCSLPSPNPTQNGVTDLHRRRGGDRDEHVGNVDRWRRWDPSGAYVECAAVLGAEFRLRMRPNRRWTLPPSLPYTIAMLLHNNSDHIHAAVAITVNSRCIGIQSAVARNISFSWDVTFVGCCQYRLLLWWVQANAVQAHFHGFWNCFITIMWQSLGWRIDPLQALCL